MTIKYRTVIQLLGTGSSRLLAPPIIGRSSLLVPRHPWCKLQCPIGLLVVTTIDAHIISMTRIKIGSVFFAIPLLVSLCQEARHFSRPCFAHILRHEAAEEVHVSLFHKEEKIPCIQSRSDFRSVASTRSWIDG